MGRCHPANSIFRKNTPDISNSFSYSGYQFYSLPHDCSISLEPEFRYSRIHDRYGYSVDDVSISNRNAKEDAYRFRLDGYVNKKISRKGTLSMFPYSDSQLEITIRERPSPERSSLIWVEICSVSSSR